MATANDKKKADKEKCRILTPPFRVSYPHVFKAQAPKPNDKKKYSIQMLFPKNGDLSKIKEAILNAKIAKWGSKENWPDELQSPVIDGDKPKYAGKEGYKGHWVIKASCSEDQKPGVVNRQAVPITEPSEFYPGCYAQAYVYACAWEYMGKEGIMFILDHVQKLKDGPAFGGKKPVSEVFKPLEDEEEVDEVVEEDSEESFI